MKEEEGRTSADDATFFKVTFKSIKCFLKVSSEKLRVFVSIQPLECIMVETYYAAMVGVTH